MAKSITHTTNPTEIIKIHKQRFAIDLEKDFDGNSYFDYKNINLKGLELDPSAHVYLYAIAGDVEKKFDLGTVVNITKPKERSLGQLPRRNPQFRLLVVDKDSGRIIASAEKISAKSLDQDKRESLLPVVIDDLGQLMWKMYLVEEEQPILYLNVNCPFISDLMAKDQQTIALVYPQLVRMSLRHYINYPTDNSTDTWQYKYLSFIKDLGFKGKDIPDLNSEDIEKDQFIDKVVDEWLKRVDIFSNAVAAISKRKPELS